MPKLPPHYTDVMREEGRYVLDTSNRNACTCSELHEPNKVIYYVLHTLPDACL